MVLYLEFLTQLYVSFFGVGGGGGGGGGRSVFFWGGGGLSLIVLIFSVYVNLK